MPTVMNNPPLNKAYPPSAGARVNSMNVPRNRNSTAIDNHYASAPRSTGGPDMGAPAKNPSPRPRRKRRCQSCLPTRRSNTSTNNPSSSRDNVPRAHRPQGNAAAGGSIRAKDLVISNPIPIDDGNATVPRGRRPGNLVPIVPFKEINRDFSSPDPSDLSSDRSRTASEARTPMSELSHTSDTDITSMGGTSSEDGEEEGHSTLSYGATTITTTTTSTGYDSGYTTSSSGGYSSSSLGGGRIPGKQMTANMHIHRLSMNMDSRVNDIAGNSRADGGATKHRQRQAPLNFDSSKTENPGGRQAVRMSTQSSDIPLHMAHPGNRQSAIVQFSDPTYGHHVATLQRSMSTAEKRRSIRLIPKDPYEDDSSSPSSSDNLSEAPPSRHGGGNVPGRHSVYGVPPPAPTPPMCSPPMSSDGYTEKSATTAGTPAPPPTGVTSDGDDLTSTPGGVHRGVKEKKSIGQVARTVLLLPPLVTVLVVDKAWRKVRGKKGPRPMGDVPGVWKVLGLAPS